MDVEQLNVVLDAKLAPLQRGLAQADRLYANAEARVAKLERTTVSSTAGMSAGFRRTEGDVARFGRQIDRTSRGVLAGSGALRSLTRSLAFASTAFLGGAGLGAALRYTIGQTGRFESRLNELQAVTRATGQQMRTVSALAKKLGADIEIPGASAADAAEAITELAKGGLSLQQSMRAAKGTLQLAAAAKLSVADAARITVSALNAFRLSGDNAVKVADLLAAAANASQGSISDMALALQQASAQAYASGLTVQETVTALTMLAKAGIQGSDAGTSLRVMLQRFIPQGQQAAKLMRELGLSVFDAKGQMLPLRDIVAKYRDVLEDLNPKQRAYVLQTIFGADATRAANIILGDGVKKYDAAAKAIDRKGEAARVAGAKTKGWEGAVQRAQNAVETLAITVGEKLLPHLTPLLTRFGNWVAKLSESESAQAKLNAGIKSAIGYVRTLAGTVERLAKAADSVATAMGGWEEAFKLAAIIASVNKLMGGAGAAGASSGLLGAAGAAGLLRTRLLGLAKIGVISIGIKLVWDEGTVPKILDDFTGKGGTQTGAGSNPYRDKKGVWRSRVDKQPVADQQWWQRKYKSGEIDEQGRYSGRGIPVRPEEGSRGVGSVQLPTKTSATHETAGLDGYPAVDIMARAGSSVKAPEDGVITRVTPFNPDPRYFGQGIYFIGSKTGNSYYIKHVTGAATPGRYRGGDVIAFVARGTKNGDHVHFGINEGSGVATPQTGGEETSERTDSRSSTVVDRAMVGATARTPAERMREAVDKARDAVSPKIKASVDKLNDLAVNNLLPKPLIDKLEQRAETLKKALDKADTKKEVDAVNRKAAQLNQVIEAAAKVSPKLQEQVARLNDLAENGILPAALVQQLEGRADRVKKALNNVQTKADVDAVAKQVAGLNNAITAATKQMDIVAAFREKLQAAKGEVAQRLQELLVEPIEQVTPAGLAKARELAAKIERQLTTGIVSDATRKRLQTQLEGLQKTIVAGMGGMLAAVERSQGRFENAWAKVAKGAMKAFDTETARGLREIEERFSGKTKSRVALDQLEAERAAQQAAGELADANRELAEAEKALTEARAGSDPDALVAAEERLASARDRLADLAYEARRRELETQAVLEEEALAAQAEREREAWEERRGEQREQLETQLAEWKEQIMTGGTAAIGEIETKLGPLAAAAGGVLGVGFTDAWTEAFGELRKTWNEFLRDVNAARVEVGLKPIGGDTGGGGGGGSGRGGGSRWAQPLSHGGPVEGGPRWPTDGVPVLAAGGEHVLNPPQIELIRRALGSAAPDALNRLQTAASGRWGHLRRFLPRQRSAAGTFDSAVGFRGLGVRNGSVGAQPGGDGRLEQLLGEHLQAIHQLLREPRVVDLDMNFPAPPAADPHGYAQRAKQALEAQL